MFGYWLYINNSVFVFSKRHFFTRYKNEILIYFDWRFWWFFKNYFFSFLVLWGFMNLFIQCIPYPLNSQCDFAYLSSSTNISKITHQLRSCMCTLLEESSRVWSVTIKHSLGYWLNITCKDLVLSESWPRKTSKYSSPANVKREGSRLRIEPANCKPKM